jgi:hypothetical protein
MLASYVVVAGRTKATIATKWAVAAATTNA